MVALTEGFPEAFDVLDRALPVLSEYAREGYLSRDPNGFLSRVLELLCVTVECLEGVDSPVSPKPHEEFLRAILPNVFGSVFGWVSFFLSFFIIIIILMMIYFTPSRRL